MCKVKATIGALWSSSIFTVIINLVSLEQFHCKSISNIESGNVGRYPGNSIITLSLVEPLGDLNVAESLG